MEIVLVLIIISILLAYIFVKVCCANKKLISTLLISIEITLVGIAFIVLGSKESYGNDGFIYSLGGLIIVVFGLFVSIMGFLKNNNE
ncbi:hypothetical protein SAMN02745134_00958 [Clostridium acidisoli DSM 12555]|uniref:Uncharacterized protein n=1 Tax=Clostridium acidisoli DSM 12555 TaxID=1121291 RepID=A0A1W1X7W7_9CLOT|nr:hypothetical protein [Clostridium acidisoli]SMC19897.1 hypothetical protein SAMN02745134_00958 [Clostridium acidisoli DSM 12555]